MRKTGMCVYGVHCGTAFYKDPNNTCSSRRSIVLATWVASACVLDYNELSATKTNTKPICM